VGTVNATQALGALQQQVNSTKAVFYKPNWVSVFLGNKVY
jgi:hypothetical protein